MHTCYSSAPAMVTITKPIMIQHTSMKIPWEIDESEMIDGIEFIQLRQNDFGFNRFITGHSRGLKGGNAKGWARKLLQKLCVQATVAACKDSEVEGVFDEDEGTVLTVVRVCELG